MATRSRIGMKLSDGTIKHVYCHYDGYPEHVGKILLQHYTDLSKINDLLSLGNLSILEADLGEKHDFDSHDHTSKVCLFYGRDRNEANNEAIISESVLDFISEDHWIEFHYLFDNGIWHYAQTSVGSSFLPLTQEVCGLEATS